MIVGLLLDEFDQLFSKFFILGKLVEICLDSVSVFDGRQTAVDNR
jgi:hypothetical protein